MYQLQRRSNERVQKKHQASPAGTKTQFLVFTKLLTFQIPAYIKHPLYIDRIMQYIRKDIIKILVGQRRVGKSYLLFQLMDMIMELDPDGQQIYMAQEAIKA